MFAALSNRNTNDDDDNNNNGNDDKQKKNKKSKLDYESVPDVEKGTLIGNTKQGQGQIHVNPDKAMQAAKQKYPNLNLDDDQARLLGTLDDAIQHGTLDLALVTTTNAGTSTTSSTTIASLQQQLHDKWIPQAKDFVVGLLQPTVTAILTMCVALYLQGQERLQQERMQQEERAQDVIQQTTLAASTWIDVAMLVFPYINATLIFAATVIPLQNRFMATVQPILDAFSEAKEYLQSAVQQLGPFVDDTIDTIQTEFHTVLKPIQPSLDQIEGKAHLLEQVFDKRTGTSSNDGGEDLDIPDPSDIDRELDEAQGIVGQKLDDAQKQLRLEDYVPTYLESPTQFYWRIVFPIIIVAWIWQMAVAYVATPTNRFHNDTTVEMWNPAQGLIPITPAQGNNDPWRRILLDNTTVLPLEKVAKHRYEDHDHAPISLDTTLLQELSGDDRRLRRAMPAPLDYTDKIHDKIQEDTSNAVDEYRDNMTSALNDQREKLHNQYHDYKDLANSTFHSLTQNMTNELHGYENDLKDQYKHYKGELDNAVAQSQSLVQDVLWSYAMAVLQMILVYSITSEAVQAWVVKQIIHQVQKGAERKLKEFGVADAMDDVFGTRLKRVREKILKLLRVYKKVEQMLHKAGAMTNLLPDGTAQQVEETLSGQPVEDAIKRAKKSKLFGKLFK